ncbi:hypothetical protein SAMN06269301_1606 [Geobacter sp. DSM 9736]|nr:hypothetical protein SAMN06269301_1606 [Geobacter sp. DSM 9736]
MVVAFTVNNRLGEEEKEKKLRRGLMGCEVFMAADKKVCPFYGKDDDYCDVGCGYISPHDVNMIIRYCSCRYKECLKYQELSDRFPAGLLDMVKI